MRLWIIFACVASGLEAQSTVAPSTEPVGEPRGQNTAEYNIRQSFEAGYRFKSIGGNSDAYRSMVNFGNGIRLLSNSLSVQSRDGHGKYFDQLGLNTQGLGNDPYQFASFRVEKNRLYRYDLTWRSNAYFNPGLYAPAGRHLVDTVRNMQDQDLTIFPQGSFKFFLGYSRNAQTGPGISTVNLFDQHRGDEFPLFANIHRQQNEYRLGTEISVLGFRLNLLHAWVNFKEDTPLSLTAPTEGNPDDSTTLTALHRTEPYHGNSPYWRVALFRESKLWAANGRFTYVSGQRAFVIDESAGGANRLGNPITRQILSYGDARRPAATGNFTFSLFPAERVTVTNQTSLYNIRMEGESYLAQSDNGAVPRPFLAFQFLGIRNISNATDAQVRVTRWLTLHGGYIFDTRRIQSVQNFDAPGVAPLPRVPNEQTNQLNSGVVGLRIKPINAVTINLDAELGRSDHPIYPISERNYQALKGRIEYKLKNIRLAAYSRTNYNTNAVALANFGSRSRMHGVDLSWTARSWFSIDASYGKQHLDTLGALQYFALVGTRNQLVSTDLSYYVSNIHTGSLAARLSIRRADISLGYSHVQDVGGSRKTSDTTQPAFLAAQTFPLRFLSPMARLSVSITPKIRWNAGYQYYGYGEEFALLRNFRANTGYTSIAWSF